METLKLVPVIAELTNVVISEGRSKYAIFLDGNASNSNDENIIDQGYFDNCYSYEQYMEDLIELDNLREERDHLKTELEMAQALLAQIQKN